MSFMDPAASLPPPRIVFAKASEPGSEPVSVATFRAYAHLDDNDDSANLTALLLAARHLVEKLTGRVLIANNWTGALERWPEPDEDGRIRIRLSPAPASVASVSVDGSAIDASLYTLRGDELVVSADLESFPAGDTITDGITIAFASSPAATEFPQLLVAIQMLAAHWVRNPEASHTFEAGLTPLPMGVAALVQSARVMRELN